MSINPKKSLGQNWLVNPRVLDRIVEAADLKEGNTVIEVGPGTGNLTRKIVETGAKIIAIEKDHRLIEQLRSEFPQIDLIEDDVLKVDIHTVFENCLPDYQAGKLKTRLTNGQVQNSGYKVIGNIPYYITSHFIRQVFEKWPRPELMVLTIQKEVAQRIIARPPKMSLLSLSVQFYADPKVISYLAPGNFRPRPKVESAIIKIVPKMPTPENSENFFKLIKAGFSGKRKRLAKNINSHLKISLDQIEAKLSEAGLDKNVRAENLDLKNWLVLVKELGL